MDDIDLEQLEQEILLWLDDQDYDPEPIDFEWENDT